LQLALDHILIIIQNPLSYSKNSEGVKLAHLFAIGFRWVSCYAF